MPDERIVDMHSGKAYERSTVVASRCAEDELLFATSKDMELLSDHAGEAPW